MKVKIEKFQEGGAAPAAPAGPGPEEQIMQMAQQIVQQLGPEGAAMLAQAIMEMLQAAAPAPAAAPTYAKQGGKLVRVTKK